MAYTPATRLYVARWRAKHADKARELNRMDNKRYYEKKRRWLEVQKRFFRETELLTELYTQNKLA
jgi:hypothetical protein